MKNLFLLVFFGLFLANQSATAQACSHANKSAEAKMCIKPSDAAMKAAAQDPNIETKVCEKSGSVCFKRKTVAADGTASFSDVRYDEATAQFVAIEADATGTGSAKSGKSCCASGKSCKKACCSKAKGTASAAPTENVAPTTNTKSE